MSDKDNTFTMVDDRWLEDLFQDYFSDINPADFETVANCEEDFIDECKAGAELEAKDYLKDKLYSTGYNWCVYNTIDNS